MMAPRHPKSPALLLLATSMLAGPVPAMAAPVEGQPISTRTSFRLGDAGVLCTAQSKPTDDRLKGMFDRAYLLTCRDAASPVGSLIAVRRGVSLTEEASALPVGKLDCKPVAASIEGVGTVQAAKCGIL